MLFDMLFMMLFSPGFGHVNWYGYQNTLLELVLVHSALQMPPHMILLFLCLRKLIFIFILCLFIHVCMSFNLVVVIQRNYIIYRFIIMIYECYQHHKSNYTLFLWYFLGLSGFSLYFLFGFVNYCCDLLTIFSLFTKQNSHRSNKNKREIRLNIYFLAGGYFHFFL